MHILQMYSYLLFIVGSVRQHGGNMEHNLVIMERCIQRLGTRGISCKKHNTQLLQQTYTKYNTLSSVFIDPTKNIPSCI